MLKHQLLICIEKYLISTVGYEEHSPKDYQSLNEHISHSTHTANKYYQLPETAIKAVTMRDQIVRLTFYSRR